MYMKYLAWCFTKGRRSTGTSNITLLLIFLSRSRANPGFTDSSAGITPCSVTKGLALSMIDYKLQEGKVCIFNFLYSPQVTSRAYRRHTVIAELKLFSQLSIYYCCVANIQHRSKLEGNLSLMEI